MVDTTYDYYHGVVRVLGIALIEDGRLTIFAVVALLLAMMALAGMLYYAVVARPKVRALQMHEEKLASIAKELEFQQISAYGRTIWSGRHQRKTFAFWLAMERHGFSTVPVIRVLAKTKQGTRNTFTFIFGAPAAQQVFGAAADQPDTVITVQSVDFRAVKEALKSFPR